MGVPGSRARIRSLAARTGIVAAVTITAVVGIGLSPAAAVAPTVQEPVTDFRLIHQGTVIATFPTCSFDSSIEPVEQLSPVQPGQVEPQQVTAEPEPIMIACTRQVGSPAAFLYDWHRASRSNVPNSQRDLMLEAVNAESVLYALHLEDAWIITYEFAGDEDSLTTESVTITTDSAIATTTTSTT